MANLSKTGIATGGTITAAQITALYDALTGTTIYDNVDSLLGNIKEYTTKITVPATGAWGQMVLKNTTGGTVVITVDATGYFKMTFSGYTLPTDDRKIFCNYLPSYDLFTGVTGKMVHFVPVKSSGSLLCIYMFDSNGTPVSSLAEDDSIHLRLLFYP